MTANMCIITVFKNTLWQFLAQKKKQKNLSLIKFLKKY